MMKNIAFHSNQLGIRGTEVALYDYALYNEDILGNKSYIISDMNSDMESLEKFKNRFDVFLYNNFNESIKYCEENNIEYVYYIKGGNNDGKILPNVKNLVHSVFQYKDVHGDKYAYISKWLSNTMSDGKIPYVPHIVNLPNVGYDYRDYLGIPKSSIVFGRYGGYEQFDIEYVRVAVKEVADNNKNIYFLFMNTEKFYETDNIIYIDPTYDLEVKSAFINTCDAMLHARMKGESFGLTIAEFLSHNKQIITCIHGEDKNHIDMIGNKGLYYSNYNEIKCILNEYKKGTDCYSDSVLEFSPTNVMNKFNEVFLSV